MCQKTVCRLVCTLHGFIVLSNQGRTEGGSKGSGWPPKVGICRRSRQISTLEKSHFGIWRRSRQMLSFAKRRFGIYRRSRQMWTLAKTYFGICRRSRQMSSLEKFRLWRSRQMLTLTKTRFDICRRSRQMWTLAKRISAFADEVGKYLWKNACKNAWRQIEISNELCDIEQWKSSPVNISKFEYFSSVGTSKVNIFHLLGPLN